MGPDRPALTDGDKLRTWGTFRHNAAGYARWLRDRGIGAGDRVALFCSNRPEFVELFLACAWVGAVAMPVNTRLAPPEVAYQLQDAEASLALAEPAFHEMLTAAAPDLSCATIDAALSEAAMSQSPLGDLHPVATDHTLGLFYTSGTTGRPKGVRLSHGNMLANSANIAPQLGFSPDDVHLHAAPMFHLADLGAFFGQLYAGAAQHVFMGSFDPDRALSLIETHRVTTTMLAPTMIGMLLRAPTIDDRNLSSLRTITYGGAPIADRVMRDAMDRLPGDLVQGFGQSEATQTVCYMSGDEHRRALGNPALLRRCGRPIPGIQVRIVDDRDAALPAGETGEVVVRGATVMTGYWNRPEETAETLRNGWLHTGDVGFLDEEGFLTLVDRKKDMIVTGAENVYSPEVENAVASHAAVAECAVIGIPDDEWGESIHAVVQLKPGNDLSDADLEAHCRDQIAGFKVPRSWSFTNEMPKTAFGKIQKTALRAPFWEDKDRQVN